VAIGSFDAFKQLQVSQSRIQSWALAAKNFDLLNDRMDVDYCRELGMKKMLVL
jgi:hypothetical protein